MTRYSITTPRAPGLELMARRAGTWRARRAGTLRLAVAVVELGRFPGGRVAEQEMAPSLGEGNDDPLERSLVAGAEAVCRVGGEMRGRADWCVGRIEVDEVSLAHFREHRAIGCLLERRSQLRQGLRDPPEVRFVAYPGVRVAALWNVELSFSVDPEQALNPVRFR